jgi:hypothetical protein
VDDIVTLPVQVVQSFPQVGISLTWGFKLL